MATPLRTIKRTLDPEPYDPGTPFRGLGHLGTVWCDGPESNARHDSRWIRLDDGRCILVAFDRAKAAVGNRRVLKPVRVMDTWEPSRWREGRCPTCLHWGLVTTEGGAFEYEHLAWAAFDAGQAVICTDCADAEAA